MTFINFSNHLVNSKENPWSEAQIKASTVFGEIQDLPFPQVPAYANDKEVDQLAIYYVDQIVRLNPDCVMCQGEFTLSYKVINMLKQKGIRGVAACSERNTVIIDGRKMSTFVFVRYRDY